MWTPVARLSIVVEGAQRVLWPALSARRLPLIVAAILGAAVVVARADSTIIDFATQDPDLLISGVAANESLGADVAVGDRGTGTAPRISSSARRGPIGTGLSSLPAACTSSSEEKSGRPPSAPAALT